MLRLLSTAVFALLVSPVFATDLWIKSNQPAKVRVNNYRPSPDIESLAHHFDWQDKIPAHIQLTGTIYATAGGITLSKPITLACGDSKTICFDFPVYAPTMHVPVITSGIASTPATVNHHRCNCEKSDTGGPYVARWWWLVLFTILSFLILGILALILAYRRWFPGRQCSRPSQPFTPATS